MGECTFHLQHDGVGDVLALGLLAQLQPLLPVVLGGHHHHHLAAEALEGQQLPPLPRVVDVALQGGGGGGGEPSSPCLLILPPWPRGPHLVEDEVPLGPGSDLNQLAKALSSLLD